MYNTFLLFFSLRYLLYPQKILQTLDEDRWNVHVCHYAADQSVNRLSSNVTIAA